MRSSILSNKQLLEDTIKSCFSRKETLNKLGFTSYSGNYKTLNSYIEKYNIDISHFLKASGFIKGHEFNKKYNLEDIFIENFKGHLTGSNLKKHLYDNNLKTHVCELCGQDENWKTGKLSFILDHINGTHSDNRIENLRIICPNCDSTLPTYMGRNNKNENSKRQKRIRHKIEKKNNNLNFWKTKISESDIDFSKKTWGIELSKITGKSPQWGLTYVKKNFPEILNKI